MRLAACLLMLLIAVPAFAGEPIWTTARDGAGDVRTAEFTIADTRCAYETMADVCTMDRVLEHLLGVDVHTTKGTFQDVTFTEEFFPVGEVKSRYHRTLDGSARIEWTLISGKQKRHDGFWQVKPDGRVLFQNVIQAKSRLHQPLLRRIQIRTMAAIVQSVQSTCK